MDRACETADPVLLDDDGRPMRPSTIFREALLSIAIEAGAVALVIWAVMLV